MRATPWGAMVALSVIAPVVAEKPTPPRLVGVTSFPRIGPGGFVVGGLSGIDRDSASGEWYLISDDRSEHGPARFWRARIDAGEDGFISARLVAPILLRDASDNTFPAPGTGAEALDGEAIRVDPLGPGLFATSEGDGKDGFGAGIRVFDRDGHLIRTLLLPKLLRYDPTGRSGPKTNLAFEGLSPSSDGRSLWLGMEAPLVQDGPVASRTAGADVRISRIDPASGSLLRQYAYHLEPIGDAPPGRLADNGLSELLSVDEKHLLVLERSGRQQSDGDFRYVSRLWCATIRGASDVSSRATLTGATYRVMRKRLVFDFSTSYKRIDSVEGMSWGVPLPNGDASLVLVTDNDFSSQRDNQVIVLDIGSSRPAAGRALCPR